MNAKDAKLGTYILNRNEPYRVIKRENVTVGTHSHSKTKLTIQGLFNGKTEILTVAHHENLEEAELSRSKGTVQLMDLESYETITAKAEGFLDVIKEGATVGYVEFNQHYIVTEARNYD